jgi:hypothetical protein
LSSDVLTHIHGEQTPACWEVEGITLDDFTEQAKLGSVDLLKIDTEGFELRVLQGARRLIDRDGLAMIQFEFNIMNVATRVFARDFLDLLPEYRFYRLLPAGLAPLGAYDAVYWEQFAYQNLVALHETRGVEFARAFGLRLTRPAP